MVDEIVKLVIQQELHQVIHNNPAVVFSKSYCPYSARAKQVLTNLGSTYHAIELDQLPDGAFIQSVLTAHTGISTVPQIFIGGQLVGGCSELLSTARAGRLMPLLQQAGARR